MKVGIVYALQRFIIQQKSRKASLTWNRERWGSNRHMVLAKGEFLQLWIRPKTDHGTGLFNISRRQMICKATNITFSVESSHLRKLGKNSKPRDFHGTGSHVHEQWEIGDCRKEVALCEILFLEKHNMHMKHDY